MGKLTPYFMGLTKTTDRIEAMEQVMNMWLQDASVYCNNCDMPYLPEFMPCCEDPQIGTNRQHTVALMIENQFRQDNLHKETGAVKDDSMRIALSMPPRLYFTLRNYFKAHGEKFPKDNRELHRMMRRFSKLCIAKKI